MRATVLHKPRKISVDTVPDPELEEPTDVILRVTTSGICGSDLHLYNGYQRLKEAVIPGHEFMGVIEEAGRDVKLLRPGDRVIAPSPLSCRSRGGHAEYVRVRNADTGTRKIDDGLTDDQVVFLTDAFPTGYAAIDWCRLQGGETVAVWGAGPVGLMAMKAAWMLGAGRVIAIDREPYRLDRAARVGKAEVIDMVEANAVDLLRDSTYGQGPDVCVDAVGMEAHFDLFDKVANATHLCAGSISAFKHCILAVKRGGQVSVVGEYGSAYDRVPLGLIFEKGLRIYFGEAPVERYLDQLLAAVAQNKVQLDDVISHRMPLSAAPEAYQMFADHTDNCVKVVLKAS
jgi:S-(hydroxymethyl)glutathione dehydrogenase / alcohol dehydrogenase